MSCEESFGGSFLVHPPFNFQQNLFTKLIHIHFEHYDGEKIARPSKLCTNKSIYIKCYISVIDDDNVNSDDADGKDDAVEVDH